MKRRVLFLCTGNSCRSQMAEGFLRQMAGEDYEVYSAGTNPAEQVHPLAVEAMQEVGIDISSAQPKDMSRFVGQPFHRVITVCDRAKEQCPTFPDAERIHWSFDDPARAEGSHEEKLKIFRQVRYEIKNRLGLWLEIDRRRGDLTPRTATASAQG